MKMINPMQAAIIKKDYMSMVSNKRLFPVLLIVPFMFTVVMPVIFILTIHFSPDDMGDFQILLDRLPENKQSDDMSVTVMSLVLNYIMPMFFMFIPILTASVMAASSFVGEKEKRTLETLLYCPLSLKQIFQSKVWASFFLSMTVSFASFILMLITVETGVLLTLGNMILPDISWLVIMLVVSPAVSLLAITFIVGGSAKAQTVEESQQRAVFLVLPILLLVAGQFSGIILIGALYLLIVGIIFAVFAFILMKRSMRKFTYELLLK